MRARELRRHGHRRRGFTLIEMMVAVVIGGISVAVAAHIAQMVVRQNAKGRQQNDFSSRTRLIGRQLRSDLRLAGEGATGAIAVDVGVTPFGMMSFPTPVGGFNAIPAIVGADGVGGGNIFPGSDAIQLVVPNPGSLQRTSDRAAAPGNTLPFPGPPNDDASIFSTCPLVYITDHTAPSGAGRAQVAFVNNATPTQLTITGQLQFSVAPGSDVMCARISTYWVDNNAILHRSDVTSTPSMIRPSASVPLFIDQNAVNDTVSPGVIDMQIAYRVSAEVYHAHGAGLPGTPAGQWVYEAAGAAQNGWMEGSNANYASWFEVRLVRINLLGRTLRSVDARYDPNLNSSSRTYARREDGAALGPTPPISWKYEAEWVTTTESVTNLRYFDLGAPERVAAEPF